MLNLLPNFNHLSVLSYKELDISSYKDYTTLMWSKYYLIKTDTKDGTFIRRYRMINGKTQWERYPKKHYANLNESELESLLNRLNTTHAIQAKEAQERYNFDHAYVNQHSMAKFKKHLNNRANDPNHITSTISMLNEYVFEFFIRKHKLADPDQWFAKEEEWGQHFKESC